MKAWFDCEFCSFENPQPISIGLVAEDGREFYAVFGVSLDQCSDFVKERVLPQIEPKFFGTIGSISGRLKEWLGESITELICDTSYDERIIRSLGIVTRIRHVKQLPEKQREALFTHHALKDARALRQLYPA